LKNYTEIPYVFGKLIFWSFFIYADALELLEFAFYP